jgi:hypothetical protein
MAISRLPDPSHVARIAAATSVDRDNRSRYHGQGVRGQPPRAFTDAKDVVFAIAELERGHAKLVAAQLLEPGSRDRKHAERDAVEHVRLAANFVDEVLDRRRL